LDKKRLTIALCANADGSHKLNPFIIGKYQKPRCFKNVNINNIPMMYCHNAKAWMITLHFQKWIQNFDRQVSSEHQGR